MIKNRKIRVAALSIASNSVLIVLKVVAGIMSGSVSIISEAIHSGMDLVASIIAFISVHTSSKPADDSHPFGHGKVENVSGVIEGLLILIAAGMIIFESVKKIIHPTHMGETTIAIVVMVISAIANIIVSRMLYKVAKAEDSIALEADALHLKTDVYTSFGVAAGLLLIKITGLTWLDPIVAICVAMLIVRESVHLTKNAFHPLLDTCLSEDDLSSIHATMQNFHNEIFDYHKLKTRKSGHIRFIEMHLTLNENKTAAEIHNLTKKIETALEENLKNTVVTFHIDCAADQPE